jgi:hypothetical protein
VKSRLFVAISALVITSLLYAADDENPYKKAKVGDYVTFKMTMKVGETIFNGSYTQTVTERTEKEVQIKTSGTINAEKIYALDKKIDITKPYDLIQHIILSEDREVQVEKLKEGKEKIKVKDKEYDCTWQSFKLKSKAKGKEEDEFKIWLSKQVGFWIVKMEGTSDVGGMKTVTTMELEEIGNKKK